LPFGSSNSERKTSRRASPGRRTARDQTAMTVPVHEPHLGESDGAKTCGMWRDALASPPKSSALSAVDARECRNIANSRGLVPHGDRVRCTMRAQGCTVWRNSELQSLSCWPVCGPAEPYLTQGAPTARLLGGPRPAVVQLGDDDPRACEGLPEARTPASAALMGSLLAHEAPCGDTSTPFSGADAALFRLPRM